MLPDFSDTRPEQLTYPMNARPLIHLWLCAISSGFLLAQDGTDIPTIEPVPPAPEVEETTEAPAPAPAPPAVPASDVTPLPIPAPELQTPGPQTETPASDTAQDMQASESGFIIKEANLNDIFQYLAKNAGRQYFHNAKIAGPEYLVTGHLNEGNPLQQMEELAFMYGLALHTKGNTIYALTQAQLTQLPSTEFHYQLRYLRPTDIEKIEDIVKPLLSPGTGIVKFEPKTNTIIIIDSAHRIEQARNLLHGIDKAKGQIVVETKILRVTNNAGQRTGVDWSASLGESGTSVNIVRDLNSVFGIDTAITNVTKTINNATGSTVVNDTSSDATTNYTNGPGLVLSPLRMTAVLRALAEGNLATQVSNPTLITEDNEQATISIIDRLPIITSTQTQNTSGGNPTVTEEVRYKIDSADPSISTDPEKHREIGISLVVTPTVLPDGTVRMKMRPRSAQIVEQIVSITGNRYPRVSESMVESIARVPDGHSLVVGGFYGAADENKDNKVPIIGDIPMLNFFFKSKESIKERASLVFIVTPKSYDPTNASSNRVASNGIRASTILEQDSQWVDPENPGPAHEPNLQRAIRGLQPTQAPYYPRQGESFQSGSSSNTKPQFSRARR
jgi:type II secretory pathway component GspD/PulD (secretin)